MIFGTTVTQSDALEMRTGLMKGKLNAGEKSMSHPEQGYPALCLTFSTLSAASPSQIFSVPHSVSCAQFLSVLL